MSVSKLAKVLAVPDDEGNVLVTFNGVQEVLLRPSELEELLDFLGRPSNPNVRLSDDGRIVWIEMDASILSIFEKVAREGCFRMREESGFAYVFLKADSSKLSRVDAVRVLRYWQEIDSSTFEGALRLLIRVEFMERHPELRRDPNSAEEQETNHRCPSPLMPYRKARVPVYGTLFLFEQHIAELVNSSMTDTPPS
ncbi:MAG: hypothetical protein AAB853_03340 [Patescibacteria group bacterium]